MFGAPYVPYKPRPQEPWRKYVAPIEAAMESVREDVTDVVQWLVMSEQTLRHREAEKVAAWVEERLAEARDTAIRQFAHDFGVVSIAESFFAERNASAN